MPACMSQLHHDEVQRTYSDDDDDVYHAYAQYVHISTQNHVLY
jgi:hypothetical protein